MILSSLLAFSLITSPPGGGLGGGLAPLVLCPDGSAAHGACPPVPGAPAPAAWLGLAGAYHASRRIRRRIQGGRL